MNIHEVIGGGVGAFLNDPFHYTPSEWCVLSVYCSVLGWGRLPPKGIIL